MTENTQTSTSDVATFDKQRMVLFVALLVMGFALLGTLAMGAFLYFHFNRTISQLKQDKTTLTQNAANAEEAAIEAKTAEFHRRQERALAESLLGQAAQLGKDAEMMIDDLETQITAWQNKVASLHGTDEGKRIAAILMAVEQYDTLQKEPRAKPEYPQELRDQLTPLLDPIHEALKDKHIQFAPNEDTRDRFKSIHAAAKSAKDVYVGHNGRLEAILANTPPNPPGDTPSLKDALAQLQVRRNEEKNALVHGIAEEARQKGNLKIAKATADDIRENKEREARKKEEEAARKREEERQRQEELAKKLAREKLEREFEGEYPGVSGLLKPFTSHGFRQPGGSGFITTTKNGPISLSRLRGRGLLEPTVPSQKALHYLISANAMNDRELGGFPEYVGGAGDFEGKQVAITRAQEFLIKYGPLMVEKGILAE